MTFQRISDWRAGKNVPAHFDTLRPVLLTLIELAKQRAPVARELQDLREWRKLWKAAISRRSEPGSTAKDRG